MSTLTIYYIYINYKTLDRLLKLAVNQLSNLCVKANDYNCTMFVGQSNAFTVRAIYYSFF